MRTPRLKYKARRDIPRAALELQTVSPTRIREWVLSRFNKAVTPQSVTVWFKRHPDIKEQLEKAITEEELSQEEVRDTIFVNGVSKETLSVKTWIGDMKRRRLARETARSYVSTLKRICQGVFPTKEIDLREHGWTYKHPDRVSLGDLIEFLDLLLEHFPRVDTARPSRVMRSFLASKGVAVGNRIPTVESNGAGKMADLFVNREILEKILQWVKDQNYEAYVCDLLMFKTATRIDAALKAKLENLKVEGDYVELRVFDKGRRSIYPEGRPWDKYVPPDLYKEIRNLSGHPERKAGKIFTGITERDMARINKQALDKFCPWVSEKYPNVMPNHFWRHMFAQHMLRKTDWNYTATAHLGGWSISALERNYGKPPRILVRQWGFRNIPRL